MTPHRIAAIDPAMLGEGGPHRRRLTQASGPQLETDERRERLLGRSTGRPAPPEHLGEAAGVGQPLGGRPVNHVADPTLDERERRSPAGPRRPSAEASRRT